MSVTRTLFHRPPLTALSSSWAMEPAVPCRGTLPSGCQSKSARSTSDWTALAHSESARAKSAQPRRARLLFSKNANASSRAGGTPRRIDSGTGGRVSQPPIFALVLYDSPELDPGGTNG
eukprot:CAMPEP_0170632282 /NCGR_PEP_ID=MMETSP0224-20130122/35236_1 /TAXON_ID=285029 /ORGANISM="Togula jolla, Strain CCCM 725" /LENGTH=118 /DNA_ID=CAMNT_0010960967 /DNA_START=534 /DNA_END=887 /DNA_ORIENTATION=-